MNNDISKEEMNQLIAEGEFFKMTTSEVNPDPEFTKGMVNARESAVSLERDTLDDVIAMIKNNPDIFFKSKYIVPEGELTDAFLIGRVVDVESKIFLYTILPYIVWDEVDIQVKISSPVIDNHLGEIWLHVGNNNTDYVKMFDELDDNNLLTAGITEITTQVKKARESNKTDTVEITI